MVLKGSTPRSPIKQIWLSRVRRSNRTRALELGSPVSVPALLLSNCVRSLNSLEPQFHYLVKNGRILPTLRVLLRIRHGVHQMLSPV